MRTFAEMHTDCNRAGHPCSYWGDYSDWLCLMGQSRDSDTIEACNFAVASKMLEAIDPDCYQIERENHWAVGWVETLLVDPQSARAVKLATEILESLEDYPVLSDDALSDYEYEDYQQCWESYGRWQLRKDLEQYIGESAGELTDDQLDEYRDQVSGNLDYEYEHTGTECLINTNGMAAAIANILEA